MEANLNEGIWYIDGRVDTRSYDDAGKPIPGTGDTIPCECCGKLIDIHVYAHQKGSKSQVIVGTQCAKKATGSVWNKEYLGSNYTATKQYGENNYRNSISRMGIKAN